MKMIDVLKRLAEIDAKNPRVDHTMTKEHSLATVSNIEGRLNECGPMGLGGMTPQNASFSINASASNGDEVANMLTQIMTLAGVKPVGDDDFGSHHEIELEPAHDIEMEPSHDEIEIEPEHDDDDEIEPVQDFKSEPSNSTDNMSDMINMIDRMNGPKDEEYSEPVNDFGGEDESPVAQMADEVRDMASELSNKADEGLGAGFDTATTTPNEKIQPHKYGNDQVTPKLNEPIKKAGGGNPYAANESVEQVMYRLMKDYQKFVAEGYDSRDAYEKHDPKHPDFKKNYDKYKAKNPKGTLADFIATLKKNKISEDTTGLPPSIPDGDAYLRKNKIRNIAHFHTHMLNNLDNPEKIGSGHMGDSDFLSVNRGTLQNATGITRKHLTKLHRATNHVRDPYQTNHGSRHTTIQPVDTGNDNLISEDTTGLPS